MEGPLKTITRILPLNELQVITSVSDHDSAILLIFATG